MLIDARGREYSSKAWIGDLPGSHRREGALSFDPLGAEPGSVTPQIRGIGGVPQRNLAWQRPRERK